MSKSLQFTVYGKKKYKSPLVSGGRMRIRWVTPFSMKVERGALKVRVTKAPLWLHQKGATQLR